MGPIVTKPAGAKIFEDYAQHVFIPYVTCQLRSVLGVHFIRDTYKDDSLKGTEGAKHGKGVRRRVDGNPAIPGNWQNCMWVDSNKTVSCPRPSFRCSVRKTKLSSSLMGRVYSAHTYFRISTSWPCVAIKRQVVGCYCMYH